MKRRRFLGLVLLSVFLAAVAGWLFQKRKRKDIASWWEPETLGRICSKEKLMELGERYQQLSGENELDSLARLLFDNFTGEEQEKRTYLEGVIVDDYRVDRTVLIDGWYLSLTEARQCAVYSLMETPE